MEVCVGLCGLPRVSLDLSALLQNNMYNLTKLNRVGPSLQWKVVAKIQSGLQTPAQTRDWSKRPRFALTNQEPATHLGERVLGIFPSTRNAAWQSVGRGQAPKGMEGE